MATITIRLSESDKKLFINVSKEKTKLYQTGQENLYWKKSNKSMMKR